MLGRGYRLRLLVGLAALGLLGGCASSATLSPPPATPTVTAAPSVAVATPTVTATPTPTTGTSPTGSPLPTIGQPADDGARIVSVTTVDARTRDLTIQSPAFGSPLGVAQVRLRNVLTNGRVSLMIVDPDNTGRFIQIRGDAKLVTDGALVHLDELTRQYTRHPRYYGRVYPAGQRARETRVICRIRARRITLDAIHA